MGLGGKAAAGAALRGLKVGDDFRQDEIRRCTLAVFADGVHFPFAVVAIDLRHDLRGVVALRGEIVAGDFFARLPVHQAAVGVFQLAEILPGVVADGEDQSFDVGRDTVQGDGDLFVIPVAFAGAVVAAVLDATVAAGQLAEIDEIDGVVVVIEDEAGSVKVDRLLTAKAE